MSIPESGGNRMLERVAAILDAVETGPMSASEVARRTELSVSTVHRLALSMVEFEFLRRDSDGRFGRGARFVRTALENAALPILNDLCEETGESTQLWVRRGAERLCVACTEGNQLLRAALPVGARVPLPLGSSGRLLAREDEAWAEIQRTGWTQAISDRTPGLGSVSAPVMVGTELVGSICLAVPLARVTDSPGGDFGEQTVRAATRLSRVMESLGGS